MEPVYQSLTDRALSLKQDLINEKHRNRVVVILAGPPGSGKTTIAGKVAQRLNASSDTPIAAVVPMDGFHLPRSTLDEMPNKAEAYARRGASWTFDPDGILGLVTKLSASRSERIETILAPSFDHAVKDPVADGISISKDIQFVILEGNYLLLDEAPWNKIKGMVDQSWFVDVDPLLAKERIAKRHIKSGIENNWESAIRRAESNDLLNGDMVRQNLVQPDVLVHSVEE
ncbi:P-loop containing nucleoside triphosphate hydrolase protein [Mollisia scopiformis]|uniref:p-loop containing nucleoside triphosphate hydrolase protein n=1 Tax=Mollisia scopiformis TaxID=149040 RepID=A0A194XNG2_MOLSC|nr:P-loop containing nucleoside triphosphate hydrolase protein [Mollisia scopiformis]KUJ21292.1 P-loop containing nucleoside triphosphate hydrolase protein [Mollisia scopiformis]